jgi:hypothetical protein
VDESASHRLKLHRARQHVQTLNAQVASFGDRDPYAFVEQLEPQLGQHVVRVKVQREPLPMWSALVGDALQDMRAALEHLAYALAVAYSGEPDDPEKVSFPITDTLGKFNAVRKQKIGLIDPAAQALIQEVQPYHRGDRAEFHSLMVLDDLARVDRHRTLHITPAFLMGTDIDMRSVTDIHIIDVDLHLGRVVDGAEIATFRLAITGPNPEMHVDVSPEFGIAFDDGWPGKNRPVVETLGTLRKQLADVIFPPLEVFL